MCMTFSRYKRCAVSIGALLEQKWVFSRCVFFTGDCCDLGSDGTVVAVLVR